MGFIYLVDGVKMTKDDKKLKTSKVGSGEKSLESWCLKTCLMRLNLFFLVHWRTGDIQLFSLSPVHKQAEETLGIFLRSMASGVCWRK